MHYEIERKFLVAAENLPQLPSSGKTLVQGYISQPEDYREVRLRKVEDQFTLTIKSNDSFKRIEHEIVLDKEQFNTFWELSETRIIVKDRYQINENEFIFDLDIYKNELQGLIMVEVEFKDIATANNFKKPAWFGREVTNDRAYGNRSLCVHGLPVPV